MKTLCAIQTLINYTVESGIITAYYVISLANNTDSSVYDLSIEEHLDISDYVCHCHGYL